VHPMTGDVWCSTNERDDLGDDLRRVAWQEALPDAWWRTRMCAPARGDRLGGVPAVLLVAVAKPLGRALTKKLRQPLSKPRS
jgi:hypothetical protein